MHTAPFDGLVKLERLGVANTKGGRVYVHDVEVGCTECVTVLRTAATFEITTEIAPVS